MVGMYIATIPNRNSPPAILLREGYRENGRVKTRTLANLSKLPAEALATLRRSLKGEKLVAVDDAFTVIASYHHGHVQAVLSAMKRLGFAALIASRPSRRRNLVLGMVAARLLDPQSKLATTRWWHTTTLPEELDIQDATEDELYTAMDWLVGRQGLIEKKLADRHLQEKGLALYDLSSSYFEGTTCPLAELGYSRDGKKGTLQVNYGLLANAQGCPVAVSVYPGGTNDPKTFGDQVKKLRVSFGLQRLVLVGDRGMIGQKQVDALREDGELDWITALKTGAIRHLLEGGALQMGLFDERNLFELTHPDFPDERLVACRNPELAKLRSAKRQDLLRSTQEELEKVQRMVSRGRLKGKDTIGVRVGRVINKYKVAKHFELEIEQDRFAFHVRQEQVAAEAALDGVYIIRTSLPKKALDADNVVRSYKQLTQVERAFRCFKGIDLKVRPIHHRIERRVRAHIFLCMLAYYVQWHLLEAWRELLFSDEDQWAKTTRDPVRRVKRSARALRKVHAHSLEDGTEAHSFQTLLKTLSTVVRNTCRRPNAPDNEPTFPITTTPNTKQRKALSLLDSISV